MDGSVYHEVVCNSGNILNMIDDEYVGRGVGDGCEEPDF